MKMAKTEFREICTGILDIYQKIEYIMSIIFAVVAQSVEQRTENPCVDSSILSDGIIPSYYRFNLLLISSFY